MLSLSVAGSRCGAAGGWTARDRDGQLGAVEWGFLVWQFSSGLSPPCNLWAQAGLDKIRMEPSAISGIQTTGPQHLRIWANSPSCYGVSVGCPGLDEACQGVGCQL